ncbi:MAG: hypothetical protein AAB415_02925 [Patescibacteria group bacterium]
MNRSIKDIEYEIVNQILISEICFDVCKSIPIIQGRGSDFLPFYYNLNFSKGIISLHSLLLSNLSDELSIKNYLKQCRFDSPGININEVEAEIASISESFKNILPLSLRHKIAAHIDQKLKHTYFTSAYIIPDSVEKYISLIQNLKKSFFKFCNYAQNNYPHGRILEQSKAVIKKIVGESDFKYQL